MHSMAGSLIMRITYGIDVQATDDPYITTAESALQSIAKAGNPGAYLGTSLECYEA